MSDESVSFSTRYLTPKLRPGNGRTDRLQGKRTKEGRWKLAILQQTSKSHPLHATGNRAMKHGATPCVLVHATFQVRQYMKHKANACRSVTVTMPRQRR